MRLKLPVSLITLSIFTITAQAANTSLGQYMTVENKASKAQIDLLSQTVAIRFPAEVLTIGDAMNYLLRYSGYSLVSEQQQSAALKTTLKKPLPLIDRHFGPMTLKEALTTLAGSAFTLIHDPLNREVNFQLRHQYAKYNREKS